MANIGDTIPIEQLGQSNPRIGDSIPIDQLSGGSTAASTPQTTNAPNPLVQGLNFLSNNPITRSLVSIAALPTQGLAKVLGQPDPFAGGIGGGGDIAPVGVTSSDQPLGKFVEETAGNAITAGSLMFPVDTVAPWLAKFLPATKLTLPATKVAVQTGLGAVQGLGGGMQQGQTGSDLANSALFGGIASGGLATAGEFGLALLNNKAAITGTSRVTAQKDNLKSLSNAFQDTSTMTTNPIKTMTENALIKDLRVIDGKINVEGVTNVNGTGHLDNLIANEQTMGTQAVAQMKGGVSTETFRQQVLDTIKNSPSMKASGSVSKYTNEVNRMFDDYVKSYGETIPYKDLDSIRTAMNKNYNVDTWDVQKAVGNAVRTTLYTGEGAGAALQSAMKNEQELINAKEFIQKMNGTAVKGGRLGKYIADAAGIGLGTTIGSQFGPLGSAIGGVGGGMLTDKLVGLTQQNYFNPLLTGPAKFLSDFLTSSAMKGVTKVGKATLIPSAVQK